MKSEGEVYPAGFSGNPTLQVGGVQDAVIAAAPGWVVPRVQVVPAGHPAEAVPAEMAAGAVDVQVKGGFGTAQPWMSTAVAVMVSAVPLLVMKLVAPILGNPFVLSSRSMHCTGQVAATYGALATPEAVATTKVCPGVFATTFAWFVTKLLEEVTMGVIVTTFKLAWLQVNGPTEAVISTPWLKAVACNVST